MKETITKITKEYDKDGNLVKHIEETVITETVEDRHYPFTYPTNPNIFPVWYGADSTGKPLQDAQVRVYNNGGFVTDANVITNTTTSYDFTKVDIKVE